MTIYIGNLSFQAEQEHLFDLFSEYGEVKNCSLPLDRETGRKRGFAFVEMVSDEDEQKAIDDLQDVEWMGRMIRVSKATPSDLVAPAAAVVVTDPGPQFHRPEVSARDPGSPSTLGRTVVINRLMTATSASDVDVSLQTVTKQ